MSILRRISQAGCLAATILLFLAGLCPPLEYPPGLGQTLANPSLDTRRTFTGSRGSLLSNERTYWVKYAPVARKSDDQKTGEVDSSEEPVESSSGREAQIDGGRLLAEVACLLSLGLLNFQVACWAKPAKTPPV